MQALLVLVLTTFQIFNQPINDTYNLKVTWEDNGTTQEARVLLVDRTNPNRFWELGKVQQTGGVHFAVDRADENSVVINARNDYGMLASSYKLFFNTSSKQIIKQVPFTPESALTSVSAAEAQRAGISPVVLSALHLGKNPTQEFPVPEKLKNRPLPKTTYSQFAKARPERAKGGYTESVARFEEAIGPSQTVGAKIWFGKTFYDGEGVTGIGGIGYFDTAEMKYNFLPLPEVLDWSVSALLVEQDTLWAALVGYPEGAPFSPGLLRYDLKSGKTTLYRVEDVTHTMVRSGYTLFLGTTNGIYALTNDKLTRYRAEPNRTGGFILVTDNP